MKIAKKVLALVMAVAMVACFAAMASAAIKPETAKFELVLDGTNVKLFAKDCVGLASADLVLSFDKDVVTAVRVLKGDDAKAVNEENFLNNTFTPENNVADLANVSYAFYFKEYLWSTEKFAAENLGDADIDANNFHVATFQLTLAEGKTAEDVAVAISAGASFTNDAKETEAVASLAATGIEKKAETPAPEAPAPEAPAPEAPAPETPAPEAPAPETPKNPEIVEGPNTGDTGVLAIAAGVVALAGAAFVVSKKRK